MKVLVIGGGGREHALAWKLAQSENVSKVFVAPGNAGTQQEPTLENVALAVEDIRGLKQFAQDNAVDLTVVGPEAPLVLGVVDAFEAAGLVCLGPDQYAAQLEGSKAFCKAFFKEHHIPTASYETFTDLAAARKYVENHPLPLVIKADGLAAGKGVVIAQTLSEAQSTLTDMLENQQFGKASQQVVVESFLTGEEISFIALCDGTTALPMATSQDHKARDNGDTGPNTGGMGAYSPAPRVSPELHEKIMKTVIEPTLLGLAAKGHPYKGFLYAGLMVAEDDSLNVLEFNCRFGDPETQPILMRLQSDFATLCHAAATKSLTGHTIEWDPRFALGVVMASGGYPGSYETSLPITQSKEAPEGVKVFHAGTTLKEDAVVTAGGRVLCVTALGASLADAQQAAYQTVDTISWDGVYYRTDIGHRAL